MNTIQTPSGEGERAAAEAPARPAGHRDVSRRRRRFIGFGSATTAIAVAAQTLGHVQSISHFAIDALHWSVFRNADMVMRVGVPLAVMAGIGLAIYGFVFHAKERRREHTIVLAAIALIVTSSAAYASLKLLPKPVTVNEYVTAEATERTKRILAYQVTADDPVGHSTGGIRVTADTTQPQQVWTTAQVLKGILSSSARLDADDVERIRSAFAYIDNQFVPDQGWGYFDGWQTGVTEIGGWVGLAQVAALDRSKPAIWLDDQLPAARASADRTLQLLVSKQNPAEGGWGPNIGDPSADFQRTYSTAIATWALIEARRSPAMRATIGGRYDDAIRKGIGWLLTNYNPQLGWVPNPMRKVQNEPFPGLQAQVVFILARAERDFGPYIHAQPNALTAKQDFLTRVQLDRTITDNNRMHDFDRYLQHASGAPAAAHAVACGCQFTVEASTFLWYPWSLAASRALANDPTLTPDQRERARQVAATLGQRTADARSWLDREFHYATAEFLIGTAPGA
ncbi:MAG TPA: hypothetical protein VN654_18665 [Vicinamibacterales bacterium]|nr:hypothetical protein [Vicinamibacterales bacterium]